MTTWSSLFSGSLPGLVPADVGKALMARAGPAWLADFVQFDDVRGDRTSIVRLNLSGATPPTPLFPGTALQIMGAPGTSARMELTAAASPNGAASYVGRAARGTPSAPSALKAFDPIVTIAAAGYGPSGWSAGPGGGQRAWIIMTAAEDWTDTAQGALIAFTTTSVGTVDPQARWQMGSGGNFLPSTDAVNDLGQPGNRVRHGYFSGTLTAGNITPTDGTVGTSKLVDGSVTTPKLADGSVTGAKIADKTITNLDIANDTLNSDLWGMSTWMVTRNGGFALYKNTLGPADARWAWYMAGVEGAGNTGNDLAFQRYDNTGAYTGTPIQIRRSDGAVSLQGTLGTPGIIAGQLWFGPGGQGVGYLAADVNATNIYTDTGVAATLFQYIRSGASTGQLSWYSLGNMQFYSDTVGNFWTRGTAFVPSIQIGPGGSTYALNADANYSNLFWAGGAYLQYSKSAANLNFVFGNVSRVVIDSAGGISTNGYINTSVAINANQMGANEFYLRDRTRFLIQSDNSTFADVVWDATRGVFIRCALNDPIGTMYLYQGSVARHTWNGNGHQISTGYIQAAQGLYPTSGSRFVISADIPNNMADIIMDSSLNYRWRLNWATGKLIWYANGVAVFSVDAGGNVRAAGLITQGVTPLDFEASGVKSLLGPEDDYLPVLLDLPLPPAAGLHGPPETPVISGHLLEPGATPTIGSLAPPAPPPGPPATHAPLPEIVPPPVIPVMGA